MDKMNGSIKSLVTAGSLYIGSDLVYDLFCIEFPNPFGKILFYGRLVAIGVYVLARYLRKKQSRKL